MDFNLTREQQMLSDVVQSFVAKEYTFQTRRGILESSDGWSRKVWSKLAEMGLLGLQVPEEYGGMGSASNPISASLAPAAKKRPCCHRWPPGNGSPFRPTPSVVPATT